MIGRWEPWALLLLLWIQLGAGYTSTCDSGRQADRLASTIRCLPSGLFSRVPCQTRRLIRSQNNPELRIRFCKIWKSEKKTTCRKSWLQDPSTASVFAGHSQWENREPARLCKLLREPQTAMSTGRICPPHKAMKICGQFPQDAWLQRSWDSTIEL